MSKENCYLKIWKFDHLIFHFSIEKVTKEKCPAGKL